MTISGLGLTDGRAIELRGQRIRFVSATVVRAERPTSARAGDTAIVLADGTIEGFVGGVCAETSVRAQALECLDRGTSVLLRIVDDTGTEDEWRSDPVGQRTVANPCLSGGTLEIFLEPIIPPALVYTVGTSPIALALSRGATLFSFDLRLVESLPEPLPNDVSAVIVASHGRGEDAALMAGLEAEVPYLGLVASPRRARAVRDVLNIEPSLWKRVHSPAGLDIGAQTPEEIALSILAQIIDERPRVSQRPADCLHAIDPMSAAGRGVAAVDPVCGMTVAAVDASLHVEHNGSTVYFCGPGCQQAFTAAPAEFAG